MTPDVFSSWLIGATLQGSAAILLVWILVPLLRRRLGARAACLLWSIVLLRLLVPWTPPSPIPWQSLFSKAAQASASGALPVTVSVQSTSESIRTAPRPSVRKISSNHIAAALWASGAALILGFSIFRSLRTSRIVRRARDISGHPSLEPVLRSLPMSTARLQIRETHDLKSPALCGLFRPTILLPRGWETHLTPQELRCILLHEIGHLRRGDLLWQWAFLIARAIHWFNPLVWLAERSARAHQEMACDEWVLLAKGSPSAAIYGETLLTVARRFRSPGFAFPILAGMAESKTGLRRRIQHLAEIRAHGWKAIAAGLSIAGILALATGSARSSAAEKSPAAVQAENPESGLASPASPQKNTARHQVQIEAKFMRMPFETMQKLLSSEHSDSRHGEAGAMPFGEVTSVYTSEQFQRILRSLNQTKGVNINTAPRITTHLGAEAKISITRERPVDLSDAGAPALPTKSPSPGITLQVQANAAEHGSMDLNIALELVEPDSSADGNAVFKADTLISLMPGQTVLIGMNKKSAQNESAEVVFVTANLLSEERQTR